MLETILVLLVVALDQLAKHYTDLYLMPLGTSVPLWQGVFHLTSVHNTGAAFGMLAGGRWILLAVSSAAAVCIALLLHRYRGRMHALMRVSLSLILAGALGNLVDRALLGYVRDMLDFRLINFAVFNLADSAVSVGAVLLGLDIFFGRGRQFVEQLDKPVPQKEGVRSTPAPDGEASDNGEPAGPQPGDDSAGQMP